MPGHDGTREIYLAPGPLASPPPRRRGKGGEGGEGGKPATQFSLARRRPHFPGCPVRAAVQHRLVIAAPPQGNRPCLSVLEGGTPAPRRTSPLWLLQVARRPLVVRPVVSLVRKGAWPEIGPPRPLSLIFTSLPWGSVAVALCRPGSGYRLHGSATGPRRRKPAAPPPPPGGHQEGNRNKSTPMAGLASTSFAQMQAIMARTTTPWGARRFGRRRWRGKGPLKAGRLRPRQMTLDTMNFLGKTRQYMIGGKSTVGIAPGS